MKKNNYRIETDSLGKVKVARNALYGAQTQRAIDNFKMSGITFDPAFIQALSNLKTACARANAYTGVGHWKGGWYLAIRIRLIFLDGH